MDEELPDPPEREPEDKEGCFIVTIWLAALAMLVGAAFIF